MSIGADRAVRPLHRTADWEQLAKDVRGRVLRPGEPGFETHTELFNRRYQDRRPAAVLVAAGVGDVVRGIRWARDHGVPLVARSGGHSFAGYSVNDGLVIDIGRLNSVHADGNTGLLTAGGGARVAQLYEAGRRFELAVPTGTGPTVGISGLALGGGAGYLSRKHGLTADAMVATTVVTADGAVLECDGAHHADLFWACRGGGGGNFGINVSFTFQAQAVPDVSTFELGWRWADAGRVLTVAQELLRQAPHEFAIRLGVSTCGLDPSAAADNLTVSAAGQHLGPRRELLSILDPLLSAATPVRSDVADRTYWDANRAMVHVTSAQQFAMRTRYATEPLGEPGIETVLSWVRRWPGSSNPDGGGVGLFSWGGQINGTPPADTAFVHRNTLMLASFDTSWTDEDPPESVRANLDWLAGLYADAAPHLSGSAYQNFPDPELTDWREAYYGANFARLLAVKSAYDPEHVFRFEQSIRP